MQFYTFILDFFMRIKKNNSKIKNNEPFKGLFTQGMVCHETYQDQRKMANPSEIEKDSDQENIEKISDKSEVKVSPSESMSKSKRM